MLARYKTLPRLAFVWTWGDSSNRNMTLRNALLYKSSIRFIYRSMFKFQLVSCSRTLTEQHQIDGLCVAMFVPSLSPSLPPSLLTPHLQLVLLHSSSQLFNCTFNLKTNLSNLHPRVHPLLMFQVTLAMKLHKPPFQFPHRSNQKVQLWK